MDWVCSMTLGRPGGPMRASAPYKGGSYGEAAKPSGLAARGRDYCVVVSTTSPIGAVRVTLRGAAAVWV